MESVLGGEMRREKCGGVFRGKIYQNYNCQRREFLSCEEINPSSLHCVDENAPKTHRHWRCVDENAPKTHRHCTVSTRMLRKPIVIALCRRECSENPLSLALCRREPVVIALCRRERSENLLSLAQRRKIFSSYDLVSADNPPFDHSLVISDYFLHILSTHLQITSLIAGNSGGKQSKQTQGLGSSELRSFYLRWPWTSTRFTRSLCSESSDVSTVGSSVGYMSRSSSPELERIIQDFVEESSFNRELWRKVTAAVRQEGELTIDTLCQYLWARKDEDLAERGQQQLVTEWVEAVAQELEYDVTDRRGCKSLRDLLLHLLKYQPQMEMCACCNAEHNMRHCCCCQPATVSEWKFWDGAGWRWTCAGRRCNLHMRSDLWAGSGIRYSFQSEWTAIQQMPVQIASQQTLCCGVTSAHFSSLFSVTIPTSQPSASDWRVLHPLLDDLGFKALRAIVDCPTDFSKYGVRSYVGQFAAVRSMFCQRVAESPAASRMGQGEQTRAICTPCTLVAKSRTVKARAGRRNRREESGADPHNKTNIRYMDAMDAKKRAIDNQSQKKTLLKKSKLARDHAYDLKEKVADMNRKMSQCIEVDGEGVPEFLKLFADAAKDGAFDDRTTLKKLLHDVADALKRGVSGSNHAMKGRRLNQTTKDVFMRILEIGGKSGHAFMSNLLLGPSLSATHRTAADSDYPMHILGFASCLVDRVEAQLDALGLRNVPLIISEDGSALQKHVDILDCRSGIYVFGLNGPTKEVKSREDLEKLLELGPASCLYVYTVVPLVEKAPFLPMFAMCHDNSNSTFNSKVALEMWQKLWKEFKDRKLNLIGHTFDGDARLRRLVLTVCSKPEFVSDQSLQVQHPLVQTAALLVGEVPRSPVIAICDFLHIIWRLRNQALDPRKDLNFGGALVNFSGLLNEGLNLNNQDLDPSDKQSYTGAVKLAGFTFSPVTKQVQIPEGKSSLLSYLEARPFHRGTYMYAKLCNRFLGIFLLKYRKSHEIVRDAAYVIVLVALWKRYLDPKRNNKAEASSGLSKETLKDVIAVCQTIIVAVAMYREHFPDQPLTPGRMSSRFSEYCFSDVRGRTKNGTKVTAISVPQYFRAHEIRILANAANPSTFVPPTRRQMPRDTASAASEEPTSSSMQRSTVIHPSDAEINDLIIQGMNEVVRDLKFGYGDDSPTLWDTMGLAGMRDTGPPSGSAMKELQKYLLDASPVSRIELKNLAEFKSVPAAIHGDAVPDESPSDIADSIPEDTRESETSADRNSEPGGSGDILLSSLSVALDKGFVRAGALTALAAAVRKSNRPELDDQIMACLGADISNQPAENEETREAIKRADLAIDCIAASSELRQREHDLIASVDTDTHNRHGAEHSPLTSTSVSRMMQEAEDAMLGLHHTPDVIEAKTARQNLVQSLRDSCALYRRVWIRALGDRITGRFVEQGIADPSCMLNDSAGYGEGDNIACLYHVDRGDPEVYYGVVEKICKPNPRYADGNKVVRREKVSFDDTTASFTCRWYSRLSGPHQLTAEEGSRFQIASVEKWGYTDKTKLEAVLSPVRMLPISDVLYTFELHKEDEQKMEELLKQYKESNFKHFDREEVGQRNARRSKFTYPVVKM